MPPVEPTTTRVWAQELSPHHDRDLFVSGLLCGLLLAFCAWLGTVVDALRLLFGG